MHRHARLLTCCSTLAVLCAAIFPAAAVEPLDTFSVKLGGYISTFDTKLKVDGGGQAGTEIKLDRDLGLNRDNTLGLLGATWRPWEHHEFGLTYYKNDASGSKTLQRDITFDGVTYDTNAKISANRNFDVYELSYIWWAASHERWALGPRIGVVWYSVDFGIDLKADANGNPVGNGSGFDRSVSGDVPAPALGGGWRWTPSDNWRISADLGYFSTSFNDVDADVTYGRFGVEWFPWENWGFWADATANDVNAKLTKNDFRGNFDFRDAGVRLGVTYRF